MLDQQSNTNTAKALSLVRLTCKVLICIVLSAVIFPIFVHHIGVKPVSEIRRPYPKIVMYKLRKTPGMDGAHGLDFSQMYLSAQNFAEGQEHQPFSEHDNQFVDYSISWLSGQILFYSTLEFSPEHVDYSVAIMSDIVTEMERITQNGQQAGVEIEDIVSGVGELLEKTYSALQVLFRENIYVPNEIINEFQQANSLFIDIQNRCNRNQDSCGEMSDVIAILEPMLDSLKNVVESSGNQSIEDEIFQIFGI